MYYVSSIYENDIVGITDTKDNVEEYYRLLDALYYVNHGIEIVGIYPEAYDALLGGFNVFTFDKKLNAKELRQLAFDWRSHRLDAWYHFRDYLASGKLGVVLKIKYNCWYFNGHHLTSPIESTLILRKVSIDEWVVMDSNLPQFNNVKVSLTQAYKLFTFIIIENQVTRVAFSNQE